MPRLVGKGLPLAFLGICFVGALTISVFPELATWVGLPSLSFLSRVPPIRALLVPIQLVSYSFFPVDVLAWGRIAFWLIIIMMFAEDRLGPAEYGRALAVGALAVGALAVGALAGGAGFFIFGPTFTIGPGPALAIGAGVWTAARTGVGRELHRRPEEEEGDEMGGGLEADLGA